MEQKEEEEKRVCTERKLYGNSVMYEGEKQNWKQKHNKTNE